MKTFDLTFNGAVLPEYDPEQVKRDFALLFRIEDAAVVDEIFSGETLVLRHNLDRKSAADYFRKITQLGGQATLVNSNGRVADPDNKVGKLELVAGGPPRIIRGPGPESNINGDSPFQQTGEIDQNWPVSTARIYRQQVEVLVGKKHKASDNISHEKMVPPVTPIVDDELCFDSTETIAQHEQPSSVSTRDTAPEDTADTNHMSTDSRETLTRLHAVATRTKTKLQVKSLELQRRSERINQLATEKLAEIELLDQATLLQGKQALAELHNLEERERHAANVLTTKMQQQETLTRKRSEQEMARLEALKKQTSEEKATALNHLQQSLNDTRQTTAQELRRLRMLLQKTRRQAETDISALEQNIRAVKSKTRDEVANLEQCKNNTLHKLESDILELQKMHTAAKQQTEKNTAELKQRQQESQRQEKEELDRLQTIKLKITQQRDQGAAEVEQANIRLRRRTQKALKHVHALELEIKRRQRGALVVNTDQEVNSS